MGGTRGQEGRGLRSNVQQRAATCSPGEGGGTRGQNGHPVTGGEATGETHATAGEGSDAKARRVSAGGN